MKLLVRNLARTTTESELKALFEEHGNVEYCTLVLDKVTGESKGFAFVEMPVKNEAKDAISKLNGTKIDKSKVRVKEAE